MLRFLSILWIIFLLGFGAFWYFWNKTEDAPQNYETMLSGALARNIVPQEKNEEVVFLRADYVDECEDENTENSMNNSLATVKSSDFPIRHNMWRDYSSLEGNSINQRSPNAFSYNGISQDIIKGERAFKNAGNSGNFGTPNIPGRNSGGLSWWATGASGGWRSWECKWIIFTPCIVIDEPNFWWDSNLHLGDTPIYKDPKAFG